ncbi:hypothetical protein B0H14DRAFT_2817468 [Mycena olivaceomarginata]|nr:hypothetical protein B0H14DRAFT_2817468 [Mycena olivaceomarginata]
MSKRLLDVHSTLASTITVVALPAPLGWDGCISDFLLRKNGSESKRRRKSAWNMCEMGVKCLPAIPVTALCAGRRERRHAFSTEIQMSGLDFHFLICHLRSEPAARQLPRTQPESSPCVHHPSTCLSRLTDGSVGNIRNRRFDARGP